MLTLAVIAAKAAAAAVAMTVTVSPGQTLGGIAASHGVSLAAVEAANPQIGNSNLIYAGQQVAIPGGGAAGAVTAVSRGTDGDADRDDGGSAPVQQQPAPARQAPAAPAGTAGGGLSSVPGVPASFAACVALRESSNGAASSNVYGIIPSSGYNGYGASLAQQKQMFAALYAKYGTAPWAPYDGC